MIVVVSYVEIFLYISVNILFYLQINMLPQSHQQFRRSVCVGCHKPGQKRTVTDKFSATIRKQIFSGYSIQNDMLPIGICSSCQSLVRRKNPFKKKFDYDELTKKFPRKNVEFVSATFA